MMFYNEVVINTIKDYKRRTVRIDMSLKGVTRIIKSSEAAKNEDILKVGDSIDDFVITGKLLDNSGESELYYAEKNNKKYVVKVYLYNVEDRKEIYRRINYKNNENMLIPIECGWYGKNYYEITEYCSNGNLESLIPLSEEQLRNEIIPQINETLKILHDLEIVHRDIKPENIFINDDKTTIKLADFGISRIVNGNENKAEENVRTTIDYASPEVLNGVVVKEQDYYSFGITLLKTVTGKEPFEGLTEKEIVSAAVNGKIAIPDTVSDEMKILIKGLTEKDIALRYGYEQVNKWLKSNAEYTFYNKKVKNISELATLCEENWEDAKKFFLSGNLTKQFEKYDHELSEKCVELMRTEDKDFAIFKLICLMDKDAPICFKGKIFKDIKYMGNWMQNDSQANKEIILEFIRSGSLEYYLIQHKFEEKFISRISHYRKQIKNGNNEIYYALMYSLCPEIGYGDKHIKNIDALIAELKKYNYEELEHKCEELINDIKFHMWIYSLGFEDKLRQWEKTTI